MESENITEIITTAHLGGVGYPNQTVADKVPPEMLPWVDIHWYQFPPMNPIWHGILGFVIGFLGFVAWAGNGVVIYIFSSTKSLRTPSNLLVVNLAVTDFLMMVFMSPMMVVNCYFETWILGPMMCQVYGLTGSLLGCTSIWTMVVIAVDRYNVIVKGLSAKPLTNRKACLLIAFVWLQNLIWTLLPVLGWNRYVPEGNMTACGTDYLAKDWYNKSYILVYAFFCYWLPLIIILYCYFFIVQAVSSHEKAMRAQAKKMNVSSLRTTTDAKKMKTEFRLAKIAMMTISLWFMAWTPYLIINYAGVFQSITISPLFTIWGSVFAKANAVYNPIVYGISHPRYRAALKRKMPFLFCMRDFSSSGSDISSTGSGVTMSSIQEKS